MIRKTKNYMDDLVAYLIKNLRKGYTKESLKWALVSQGHSKLEVEKALMLADHKLSQEAPILETKPEISYELVEPKIEEMPKKSFWKRMFGG